MARAVLPLEAPMPRTDTGMEISNSKEQLQAILADLSSVDGDHVSLGSAITEEGKRRQMAKMLTLIMIPIFVLLSISFYFMTDNVRSKLESDSVRTSVQFSTELGQLIHLIQKERDMSVLYLSSIGPETKTFLAARYQETDEAIEDLTDWPVDLDRQKKEYFTTKRLFRRHLNKHRNNLQASDTIFNEVDFYSDLTFVLIKWIYDAIRESRYGTIWKSLVAYQKVVSAKEQLGVERALGSAYFSRGAFIDIEAFYLYNEKRSMYKANINSALLYAPYLTNDTSRSGSFVEDLDLLSMLISESDNISSPLAPYQYLIRNQILTAPSLRNATAFYDNMTLLIGEHLVIQRAISNMILKLLDARSLNMTSGVVISSIIIGLVLAMCPLLVKTVERLTDNIQNYAVTLADKTQELNKEKKRTDSLLYQMLPRPIAEELKRNNNPEAEFFKEVTIFFSDILGFSRLIRESKPIDIVNVLNEVYTMFDKRIGLYDVYKVETIGDSYMIASGLPLRNGSRHATEIANIALDLLNTCGTMEVKQMPEGRLRLRIGIHTGQCVAGVVGVTLPRYCVFGDTVNTASRMETTGLPNCIHLSSTTQRLLKRSGQYIIRKRGTIEVKGKGEMTTYFLLGRNVSPQQSFSDPGESELSITASFNLTKQEQGAGNSSSDQEWSTVPRSVPSGSGEVEKHGSMKKGNINQPLKIEHGSESMEKGKDDGFNENDEDNTEQMEGNATDAIKEQDEQEEAETEPQEPKPGPFVPTQRNTADSAPPSYSELEAELRAKCNGSPPIFRLVEGYHY